MLTGGDFEGRFLDGHGFLRRQQAEFAVGAGAGPLDQAERPDELARHRRAADREVVDRPLRLGAPEGILGDAQFTHAVVLDPKTFVAHASISLRRDAVRASR